MARMFNRTRIGELLVKASVITEKELQAALVEQKSSDSTSLGEVLQRMRFATDEDIAKAIADQFRLEYYHLKQHIPSKRTQHFLTEAQARRLNAIVINELPSSELLVGFVDPTNLQTYDDVARITGRSIDQVVISRSDFYSALDRLYLRNDEIQGITNELQEEFGTQELTDSSTGVISDQSPVARFVSSIFDEAVRARTSDIHIEPNEHELIIRFRIDGHLKVQSKTSHSISAAIVQRLKLISGLDISERRIPQDGRFNIQVRNAQLDVRISTLPAQYGESVVMRILVSNSQLMPLDEIGMPDYVIAAFRKTIATPRGIILVTGPTGSGKTTTLYSALAEINKPDTKIITAEDPVEIRLPGLTQVQIREKVGLTFANVLRSSLRQDPDVVLVGEMRDTETAETGMRAALTGHLVLTTLHTNDALSTPLRLLDMEIQRFLVASAVRLIIAQRLIRVICEDCAQPDTLSSQHIAWLSNYLKPEELERLQPKRGAGCNNCAQSGYRGRAGVYEALELDIDLTQALMQNDNTIYLEKARKFMEGKTLINHAISLLSQGKTTMDEIFKVSLG